MEQAQQETPKTPTIPSLEIRILRAKLIMEEAFETIERGLGVMVVSKYDGIISFENDLWFEEHQNNEPDLVHLADGCADLKVVTVGTEIACGINGKPIFEEVMRSNFTKFIDGYIRDDGKWQKGPSYERPQLEPILKHQGMK